MARGTIKAGEGAFHMAIGMPLATSAGESRTAVTADDRATRAVPGRAMRRWSGSVDSPGRRNIEGKRAWRC